MFFTFFQIQLGLFIFRQLPLNSKAQLLRPMRGRFVNASAVALLSFLYLLNLTQVTLRFFFYFSSLETVASAEANLVDLYPSNGGYSVMGVDAESAVGLLGLLLFIDLMRVHFLAYLNKFYMRYCQQSIEIWIIFNAIWLFLTSFKSKFWLF